MPPPEPPSPAPGPGGAPVLSRRSLLVGAGAAAVTLGLWGSLAPRRGRPKTTKGTLIGPGRFMNTVTRQMGYDLCLFDLDEGRNRTIPMDFFGHGFAPDPLYPRRAVLFEKRGPGCCEVDLVEARVVRPIRTPEGRHFYGHGAFSRDGGVLFATENRLDTHEGLIAIRDGKTFQEIGQFPTYGKNPHDCHLIDEGKTLVMTNGGGSIEESALPSLPGVTFVDVKTSQLLERLVFDTPRINAGHLALTKNRDVVAISAPRDGLPKDSLGGVTIRSGGGPFVTMTQPADVIARMIGESLSLCIHEETAIVGVTNPDGNIVTFWNTREKSFVKKLDLPAPRGFTKTLDGEYFALGYGAGTLTLVSPETLEPVSMNRVPRSTLSGSHLFTWDPRA